jgi:hypothetical protein
LTWPARGLSEQRLEQQASLIDSIHGIYPDANIWHRIEYTVCGAMALTVYFFP